MADNIRRCKEEDSPNRCQANGPQGQCMMEVTPGGKVCPIHGGIKTEQAIERKNQRLYQLAKWQVKLDRQADAVGIKTLREEIGILRMLLEEKLNSCHDETALLLESGAISDLVIRIKEVVVSCHKLEGSMGQLLDKQAILQFASEVVGIISDKCKDHPELLQGISDEIMQSVARTADSGDPFKNEKD